MEFIIAIIVAIVVFTVFMVIVRAVVYFLRWVLRLPHRENARGWASHEDFIFGKPMNRYERRERKGRLKNW